MLANEELLKKLYGLYQKSSGVCIDTRKLQKDQLFFCLKGPNFDANQFARQAIQEGAIAVVTDDPANSDLEGAFVVDDALAALQGLARYHRRLMPATILAITGSNGKTTTKELVREVLATKYRVYATEGNLNNHIGVPLTLLRIKPETEIAVIEMGANHVGEIGSYCLVAEPDAGMITNIGKAHLEGFGGVEGIIRGKTELFDWLRNHNGMVFLNGADKVLGKMKWRFERVWSYPTAEDDFKCEAIDSNGALAFQLPDYALQAETHLEGIYNLPNVAAALCIGNYFEVNMKAAVDAVAAYKPENQRSQLIRGKKASVILDAYNANPTSMQAALESLARHKGPRWAVLGDMFELGEDTEKEHRAMVELALNLGIEKIFLCGKHFAGLGKSHSSVLAFAEKKDLQEFIAKQESDGAVILIKGSRGMAMETLLNHIAYD